MDARKLALGIFAAVTIALSCAAASPASAQAPPGPGPNNFPSCGVHSAENASEVVGSSPAGSVVAVTIWDPSWDQVCFSFAGPGGSTGSVSFVAYEIFPITVNAPPGTTVRLEAGEAIPTPQQISGGVRNTTIWTWFDPSALVTNSSGVARSNLTLAGAVMPFVPNDFANVTLPIVASALTGASGSAGLPIEVGGGGDGGIDILQSPAPLIFSGGVGGPAGSPSRAIYNVAYAPPNSTQTAAPLQVSLQVLGSYQNGSVGPLPPGVQVSIPQASFEVPPNSVYYFLMNENNSLKLSNTTNTYTFAVQEKVDNSTYVEPLAVSVSPPVVAGVGEETTTTSGAAPGFTSAPVSSTSVAGRPGSLITDGAIFLLAVAVVVLLTVGLVMRRHGRVPTNLGETQDWHSS